MLLHVDHILVVCSRSFLDDKLLKALKSKYKVSAEAIRDVGDSITFLKTKIALEDTLKLIMYPHESRLFLATHNDKPSASSSRYWWRPTGDWLPKWCHMEETTMT